jgi:hypothetical protein
VRSGSNRDALLYAIRANARDGVPLTAKDRRRAVEELLRDEEWRQWSDRQIARHCGVDHKTVGACRARLQGNGEIPQSAKRKEIRAGKVREKSVKPRSNGRSLTDAQVDAIRADTRDLQTIAEEHNINKSQVSKIKNNQLYRGENPEELTRLAALQRAWQTAEEPTRKEFIRWLWQEHPAMIWEFRRQIQVRTRTRVLRAG